jgi:hypothetical protein
VAREYGKGNPNLKSMRKTNTDRVKADNKAISASSSRYASRGAGKSERQMPATNKPKALPPLKRDAAADAAIRAKAAARKQSESARLDASVKGLQERAVLQNKAKSNPFRPRPMTGGYGA